MHLLNKKLSNKESYIVFKKLNGVWHVLVFYSKIFKFCLLLIHFYYNTFGILNEQNKLVIQYYPAVNFLGSQNALGAKLYYPQIVSLFLI